MKNYIICIFILFNTKLIIAQNNSFIANCNDSILNLISFNDLKDNKKFEMKPLIDFNNTNIPRLKNKFKNYYKITCDCNINDLKNDFESIIGTNNTLFLIKSNFGITEPNDYGDNNWDASFPDWALDKIQALKAWELTKGSKNIRIAISDRDFDFEHEEYILELQGDNTYLKSEHLMVY